MICPHVFKLVLCAFVPRSSVYNTFILYHNTFVRVRFSVLSQLRPCFLFAIRDELCCDVSYRVGSGRVGSGRAGRVASR